MTKDEVAAEIEPFGVLGSRYQVDAAGLRLYRVTWAITLTFIVVTALAFPYFELTWPVRWSISGIGMAVVGILVMCVAKMGTKLPAR